MITFKENTKDNAENLSVSRLSLPQEINILSGIMLLISVPLGIAAAFSAKLDAAVFVYKIGVFCYLFWFLTQRTFAFNVFFENNHYLLYYAL